MINQLPINLLSEMQLNNLVAIPPDSVAGSSTQNFLAQYLQILEQIGSPEPSVGRPHDWQTLPLEFGNQTTLIDPQDLPLLGEALRVVLEGNGSVQELPHSGKPLPSPLLQGPRESRAPLATLALQRDGVHDLVPGSKLELAAITTRFVTGTDGVELQQQSTSTANQSNYTARISQSIASDSQPTTNGAHAIYSAHSDINSGSVFMASMQESSSVLAKELSLEVPMGQPKWEQALGNRVQWMINNNHLRAELRLNPPQLGPLDVRISIEGEQTSINFASPHGLVRESLENALPQLREMLSATGLNQVDVNVSHQSLADQGEGASSDVDTANRDVGTDEGDATVDSSSSTFRSEYRAVGLVDYYA